MTIILIIDFSYFSLRPDFYCVFLQILKCLKSYNMLSGSEEADYLIFCMEKWRLLSRKRDSIETVANNFIANPSHQLLKLDSNKVEETASSSATTPLMKMGRRKGITYFLNCQCCITFVIFVAQFNDCLLFCRCLQ